LSLCAPAAGMTPDELADAICFMLANATLSGELWVDAGWHPPA
jgi:hypothetical protein